MTGEAAVDMPDVSRWVRDFVRRHGRKPRILHIGNIANNAFINCKLLNDAGLDCDLICYDYFHLMGCPEWEEADIEVGPEDQAFPDWTKVDLRGYRRPRWFAQGPLGPCIDYLLARRQRRVLGQVWHWRELGRLNRTRRPTRGAVEYVFELLERLRVAPEHLWCSVKSFCRRVVYFGLRVGASIARRVRRILRRILLATPLRSFKPWLSAVEAGGLRTGRKLWEWLSASVRRNPPSLVAGAVQNRVKREARPLDVQGVCARFASYFPDRPDKLQPEELNPYLQVVPRWSELFDHYDLIQAYATEPILPALTGHRAVAFEHGTLRTFLWGDTPLHRLTSLGYRHAAHVFVTNGDCLEHAERLGVRRYSSMLHPVDVDQHRTAGIEQSVTIRAKYAADCLLLCPLRHDWAIKGTDVHLRALPLIKARYTGRLVVLLTEWGGDLEASRALVRELGCEENVRWIAPLGRIRLIAHTRAADVVLDQIALPHFGATAPQALAVGTPVISSYDPRSTEWIVDEPAPILPAFTPQEVADAVLTAMDPAWRVEHARRARDWIDHHHHHRRVVADHLEVYERLIEERE